MKKIYIPVISGLISINLPAQMIPNSGFENWTNKGTYEVPDSWGTLNNTTSAASVYTATKGSPGNPGSFYLKLTSKTVGPAVANGIAVSGKLDSTTMQPKSGFPCTMRPQAFTGKWQHMIYGTSQGLVSATLTRWDAGQNMRVTVATASQTLSGMAMSWENFSINFTYQDGGTPDTCIIRLQASGANPVNNDYLWVDDLAFSGTVSGTGNTANNLPDVRVFPIPADEHMMLQITSQSPQQAHIGITDLTGKILYAENAGTVQGEIRKSIDVASLPRGMYFVKVVLGNTITVKKVIIE